MLMEHETLKLKQLEEEHSTELKEWKANLKPRKQVLNFTVILISSFRIFLICLNVFQSVILCSGFC